MCNVSKRTVRRWISTGHLPAFRYGKRLIRIERKSVEGLGRPIPTVAVRP